MVIDLRSDTVTKPTPQMLSAMMQAKVGDDVYKEDPTVNALEEKVAKMFGKEMALFFPSGTMANQAAIKLHTQPGEQLIADKYAHIYNYEGGGASFNSGVSCKLLEGTRGMLTATQVQKAINPPDFYHSPLTTLVCLENTTNKGGGACYDLVEIRRIREVCDQHGLGLHLDGARLWNAIRVRKDSLASYGMLFDTISVCFSKGLGAPMGSMLIGDGRVMKKALRIRKILGGAMRQIGYMAAAANYAIDNHMERLDEDHSRAKALGACLEQCSFVKTVAPVTTNIIIFESNKPSESVIKAFAAHDVYFYSLGETKLRMVTHLDYTDAQHQYVLKVIPNIEVI